MTLYKIRRIIISETGKENPINQKGRKIMKKWYAVQRDRSDAWDNGSHSYEEAVEMLKEQGYGLIAVIDEDNEYCLDEIEYSEIA